MFEQTILDTLIVIGMFVLRIGVPVAILFGVAAWVDKKLRPQETQETGERTSTARIITFQLRQRTVQQASAHASTEETAKRANVK
jgi:hypothetical protein